MVDTAGTKQTNQGPAPLQEITPPRKPVTWRSLLVGMIGVCFINALTPFNNHVLQNTDLVSNALPIGVLMFLFLFVLFVNAPLRRFAPRQSLDSGELSVVLGMMLVGCALPYVGLMRYLPGHLINLWYYAAQRADYAQVLRALHLPDWLFPTFSSSDVVQRGNDPVVRDYVGRVVVDQDTFATHFWAVPWRAWMPPFIAWGLFLAGLFGSVICLMVVFRRQWVENERLQFPLATVFLSLIEPPAPGKLLSPVLRRRAFWFAFAAVFLLHAFNGLSIYFPRLVPQIPMSFNLSGLFSEEPWRYTEWDFQCQQIFFTVIGITYFVQTRVSFSLWFCFLCVQVARMSAGVRQSEISTPMEFDQCFGAVVVLGFMILWVARQHLLTVARQMFRKPREDEAQGRYLPYALAGWGLLGCMTLLVVWLCAAGTSVVGAIVIVLMLMLLYLVLAKVVSDTGMLYTLLPVPVSHPWDVLASSFPNSTAVRTTLGSYFFSRFFSGVLGHDMRQALPPYAIHAMAVADQAAYPGVRRWTKAISFTLALLLALGTAYAVSGASMLFIEYKYAATLDRNNSAPINSWGSQGMVQQIAMDPTVAYFNGNSSSTCNHFLQFGIGAGITAALSACRLNLSAWPIHPVGYLLVYTWGLRQIWFSIFLGWVLKVLIVNYAGARVFQKAQPFFLGLLFGEVIATAFWLVLSLALALSGHEYRAVTLLPV